MARRSPLNERYQKHTAPAGKTRKSAAAAKPKRDAAGASKPSSSQRAKARPAFVGNPPTEEFRRLRRIWWVLLGTSLVFTMGSVALQRWGSYKQFSTPMLAIGYGLIFAALILDLTKIRTMRKAWLESGAANKTDEKS